MKFPIKYHFSKCDQICSYLQIWSQLLKKSFMENFIFLCSVPWLDRAYRSFRLSVKKPSHLKLLHQNTQ